MTPPRIHAPRCTAGSPASASRRMLGASAAFGPNSTGGNTSTQIYGVDAFYKWKPSNASGGWPFVKVQTEAMYRRFQAGQSDFDNDEDGLTEVTFPSEVLNDWGTYSQVLWGFSKGWVAGLRGDYLDLENSKFALDSSRQDRWRLSPNLSFYPTEFSKIRLQYNHDVLTATNGLSRREEDTIILQFEFFLGAHEEHDH